MMSDDTVDIHSADSDARGAFEQDISLDHTQYDSELPSDGTVASGVVASSSSSSSSSSSTASSGVGVSASMGDVPSGRPTMKPDSEALACEKCSSVFSFLNRRHHCRACGGIFCAACSTQQRLLPPEFHYEQAERVCDACANSGRFWPFEVRSTSSERGEIEYARIGHGRRVVVAIHSGPGGADQGLLAVQPLWASTSLIDDFTVIAVSRPGYRASSLDEWSMSFDHQADAILAALDTLQLYGKVAVVGVGLGAPTAIHFAASHPERTAALVLLSPVTGPYWPGQGKGAEQTDANLSFGAKLFLGAFQGVTIWASNKMQSTALVNYLEETTKWDDSMAAIHAYNIGRDPVKMWLYQAHILSMYPISERKSGYDNDLAQLAKLEELPLNKISVPTLVFHGADDADVLPSHSERLREIASVEILDSTGANVYLGSKSEHVRESLLKFLFENLIA